MSREYSCTQCYTESAHTLTHADPPLKGWVFSQVHSLKLYAEMHSPNFTPHTLRVGFFN